MGKSDNRVATAVRLPREIHERLVQESEQRDLSINILATRAIERYLKSLRPIEDHELAS